MILIKKFYIWYMILVKNPYDLTQKIFVSCYKSITYTFLKNNMLKTCIH